MNRQVLGDRYRIVRELSQADDRRTLLAEDMQTRSPVVIKLLIFRRSIDPDAVRLFKREAETLKSLNHPAIPRYLNFFELEPVTGAAGLALVQTFIQGRSLEAYLQFGRRFSEAETSQIGAAVLDILVYLHGLNPPVIHRDIKPANILLSERGTTLDQVYLVDFGAVKNVSVKETTTLTIVGTRGYMPPEQFSGRVTTASDLYSLGTTLITVATSTPIANIPHRNLRLRFEDLVPLTPEFVAWLKWLTELEASNRPASAQEALQRLLHPEQAVSEQHTPAPTTGIARKPAESKITLVKAGSFLEIRTPPIGITVLTVWVALGILLGDAIAVYWLKTALQSLPRLGLAGLLPPLLACLVAVVITGLVLFVLLGRTRLRLDDRISLSHDLFGLQYVYAKPDNIRKIIRLASVQTSSLPHLIVQAGATQYILGKNLVLMLASRFKLPTSALGALTVEEVNWLAQELSHWLKLSISRR